ncbi:MAG: dockerin type I domain-containing protein [Planctomycetota bacterium]
MRDSQPASEYPSGSLEWEFLEAFDALLGDPTSFLMQFWHTAGNVTLDADQGEFNFTPDSSLSQMIAIPPGTFTLKLNQASITQLDSEESSNGSFYVSSGGELLDTIALSAVKNDYSIELANDSSSTRYVPIEISFESNNAAGIGSIEAIEILEATAHDFSATVTSIAESTHIAIDSSADPTSLSKTRFFLESNSLEGLQIGDFGDVEIVPEFDDGRAILSLPALSTAPTHLMKTTVINGQTYFETVTLGDRVRTNLLRPFDVSNDGEVSPLDALIALNYVARGPAFNESLASTHYRPDVNGDGVASPLDALLVINHLARLQNASSGSEGEEVRVDARDHQFAVLGELQETDEMRLETGWLHESSTLF